MGFGVNFFKGENNTKLFTLIIYFKYNENFNENPLVLTCLQPNIKIIVILIVSLGFAWHYFAKDEPPG